MKNILFTENYLKLHASILWDYAEKNNQGYVLTSFTPAYVINIRKDKTSQEKYKFIKTQEEFINLFIEHNSILSSEPLKDPLKDYYLQRIFSLSTYLPEQTLKNEFFEKEKEIVQTLTMSDLIKHAPSLSKEELIKLISSENYNKVIFEINKLPKFIEVFDNKENNLLHDTIINYIVKHTRGTLSEDNVSLLKNTLLENYKDEINKFSKIKFVRQYMQQHQESIALEEEVLKTFYLKLDLNVLKNKFVFPSSTARTYTMILENFVKSLRDVEGKSEIMSVLFDSRPGSYNQHVNNFVLYINCKNNSNLSLEILKETINSYFMFIKDLNAQQNAGNSNKNSVESLFSYMSISKTSEKTKEWLETKLFHDSLHKELDDNKSTVKKHKL